MMALNLFTQTEPLNYGPFVSCLLAAVAAQVKKQQHQERAERPEGCCSEKLWFELLPVGIYVNHKDAWTNGTARKCFMCLGRNLIKIFLLPCCLLELLKLKEFLNEIILIHLQITTFIIGTQRRKGKT